MSTTANIVDRKESKIPIVSWIVLVILAVLGLVAWGIQLNQGMAVTSLNQQIVWGLYIATFFTAASGGAGLLVILGLGEYLNLISSQKRVQYLLMALSCFIVAGLAIMLDTGSPLRAWRIAVGMKFNAMMTLDFWLLILCGLVTLIYLWVVVKDPSKIRKVIGAIAVLSALSLIYVEWRLLAGMVAHPLWGGITLISFIIGMFIVSLALMLLGGDRSQSADKPTGMNLKMILAFGLGLSFIMVVIEVLIGLFSSDQRTSHEIQSVLTGNASPFFWFQIALGLIVPLALLFLSRSKPAPYWAISPLAILGVFAGKMWLLSAGQELPWIESKIYAYFPSWVEISAVVGVVAIGALVYAGLATVLPGREQS